MKRLAGAVATIAFSVFTCGLGNAADLPLAPPVPYVPAPTPVYNWTGIYVGVNGGYGFGQQTPGSLFGDSFSAFDYNANGWLGGGTVRRANSKWPYCDRS